MTSAVFVIACSTDQANERPCVDVALDCKPIVNPPTFDALHANIFSSSCATGTGRCHNSSAAGNVDMRTPDAAFDALSTRVRPDSPGCSELMKRIESDDPAFRMPPGNTPLSEAQRCAIGQWIANGAKR